MSPGKLRVLAVVPYPIGRAPGQRYRLEQWVPHLAREGIEIEFSAFLSLPAMEILYESGHWLRKGSATLKGFLRRLRETADLRGFDALWVYREAAPFGPGWLESFAALKLPMVFEFDDAIYLPSTSAANRWASVFKRPGKTASICRNAAHVVVGNEFLAEFARRHSPRVTVIPSTIDTERYRVIERPPKRRPIVGWTGTTTTAPFLAALGPVLARLRRIVDFELLAIGARVEIAGVDVRFAPWDAETEPEDLSAIDIGLMPLPDDEWARGKCGMKALQYMGLGIPPVVSPIGVNASIVRDGINGFHARNDEEWIDRVGLLVRDAGRRAEMGIAARRTVETDFSAQVHAPRVADVIRQATRRQGGEPVPNAEVLQ